VELVLGEFSTDVSVYRNNGPQVLWPLFTRASPAGWHVRCHGRSFVVKCGEPV